MNNYLDSIVNELKDFPQSNSEILNLIQSRKNVYNRFKREFIKNINTIENEDLIAFALLIAAKNTDFELHQILSEHFDFNNINNPLAIFAKGIHGSKSGQNFAAFNLLYHRLHAIKKSLAISFYAANVRNNRNLFRKN